MNIPAITILESLLKEATSECELRENTLEYDLDLERFQDDIEEVILFLTEHKKTERKKLRYYIGTIDEIEHERILTPMGIRMLNDCRTAIIETYYNAVEGRCL